MRLFGGILIFAVFTYSGFYMSGRLKKRRDFLCIMSDALAFIATEIEFAQNDLAHIFRRVDEAPALCNFFKDCAKRSETSGMSSAWELSVNECVESAALKTEERQILVQLGTQIGKSDIEGQKKTIKRAISQLDMCAKTASTEYERLARPYRSCGILLGVFVLIIIA